VGHDRRIEVHTGANTETWDPARFACLKMGEPQQLSSDILHKRDSWFAIFDAAGNLLVKANGGRGVQPTLFDRVGKELMVVR